MKSYFAGPDQLLITDSLFTAILHRVLKEAEYKKSVEKAVSFAIKMHNKILRKDLPRKELKKNLTPNVEKELKEHLLWLRVKDVYKFISLSLWGVELPVDQLQAELVGQFRKLVLLKVGDWLYTWMKSKDLWPGGETMNKSILSDPLTSDYLYPWITKALCFMAGAKIPTGVEEKLAEIS